MDKLIILGVAIPIIVYLFLGIIDSLKIKILDQFFFADRNLFSDSFAINAEAANYSFTTAVFVLMNWSYKYGPAVWWTIITAVIGFIIWATPKLIEFIPSSVKDKDFPDCKTLHEYLGRKYNLDGVRLAAAVATITAFLDFFQQNCTSSATS